MRSSLGFCVFVLASLVCGATAAAQCPPVPDQLDGGPCCAVVDPKLPKLPGFSQASLGICWRDCDVDLVTTCSATWQVQNIAPVPGATFNYPCGLRLAKLSLDDGSGIVKWRGRMQLFYSRTWLETDVSGTTLQVWRFLVNGDLRPTSAAGPIPCPVPPCAPAFGNRVRFTGYLDYALDCANNVFRQSWMLTHTCDAFDHALGFPRGGVFHPTRSYTFVGPGSSFAPSALVVSEATPFVTGEAYRQLQPPPPGTTGPLRCQYEELPSFEIVPVSQLCVCGPILAPPQQAVGRFTLTTACGTLLTSPGGPFLPGLVSMSLGSWTDPLVFPGVERVRWNAGGYDHADACTGISSPQVYYGVTTSGGFPATQFLSTGPGGPLPPTFIDQANALGAAGPVLNLPFTSDQVLNLNY